MLLWGHTLRLWIVLVMHSSCRFAHVIHLWLGSWPEITVSAQVHSLQHHNTADWLEADIAVSHSMREVSFAAQVNFRIVNYQSLIYLLDCHAIAQPFVWSCCWRGRLEFMLLFVVGPATDSISSVAQAEVFEKLQQGSVSHFTLQQVAAALYTFSYSFSWISCKGV